MAKVGLRIAPAGKRATVSRVTFDQHQFLTLDEAATCLDVAPSTLARWIALGRFPAYRTPGGRYRIAVGDLQLALEPARPQKALRGEASGGS